MASFDEALGPSEAAGASFGAAMTMRSSGKGAPNNLAILQELFTDTGANGGAWDFTDSANLFQDSGRTTPVTTSGDLVGSATDESGNGINIAQGTAANKPEWVANGGGLYGLRAIDASDLLAATIGGSVNTTFVCYVTNPASGTDGLAGYQYQGSNYSLGLRFTSGNWYIYRRQFGDNYILIKTAPTADEEATLYFKNRGSSVYREAQYNDETPVTDTAGLTNANYGDSVRIPQSVSGVGSGIIHRAIWMEHYATDDEIATLKTLVQQGW